MANVNIFDKYGIKEVANVYFEALEDDLAAGVYKGDIVLFLDTLKVSTIETTGENTAAQGGWGNPKLIQWDYGKEINITLEDALMSLESLRFMLGGTIKKSGANSAVVVQHTAEVVCGVGGKVPKPKERFSGKELTPTAWAGHPIKLINLTTGARTQIVYSSEVGADNALNGEKAVSFKNPTLIDGNDHLQTTAPNDRIRIFWDESVTTTSGETSTAVEVTISPDTFPGTYKVVGDTFMRSQDTGKDEPFQFIIDKAKVQSSVTLTLQAEGDPTTFEMTLNVLRSTYEGKNSMMRLVRYNVEGTSSGTTADDKGSIVAAAGS